MSKSHVSRDAAAALSTIDTALRRATDLHWSDPEFQAWEAGQTTDLGIDTDRPDSPDPIIRYWAHPGPDHDRSDDRDWGVIEASMVALRADHSDACGLCIPDPPIVGRDVMRVDDYPPPEATTYGPLLLGPEPPPKPPECEACDGEGEMDSGCCDDCDGAGVVPVPDGQGVIR